MSRSSAVTADFANLALTQSGATNPQIGETSRRVINAIKQMYAFPHTASVLGRWLKVSDRTAKRKLNHERVLSAEDLGMLIRSERGFEIVTAIMGDAMPEWWRLCSVLMDAADIRKMQIAAQRRAAKILKGVIDADRDLSESIQRAETLAFYGSEQAGLHADALRSMAGPSPRAMAEKTKR